MILVEGKKRECVPIACHTSEHFIEQGVSSRMKKFFQEMNRSQDCSSLLQKVLVEEMNLELLYTHTSVGESDCLGGSVRLRVPKLLLLEKEALSKNDQHQSRVELSEGELLVCK